MFHFVLVLNAIWFALGFHLFALRGIVFAKILVPQEHRESPIFDMLIATGKFMGGFNFAFCVLNVLMLCYPNVFLGNDQRAILLLVFAIAHGSQFVSNVPIAIANRKGEGVWQVKGLMLFIFIIDFTLMMANIIFAINYFLVQ